MSKGQMLRALVNRRLVAAAEEIFGLFERTMAEYEEQLSRSREENERQRKLLDALLKPEVRLRRAEVEQLPLCHDEVPAEPLERSACLDPDDPELLHIKEEEEEELWSSQEGEQLRELEDTDITRMPFIPVLVKSENDENIGGDEDNDDDEEGPHSMLLHQSETDDYLEEEPLAGSSTQHRDAQVDGDDGGEGPEPAGNYDPDSLWLPYTDDKVSDSAEQQWFSCSECSKRFRNQAHLVEHFRIHTGEKPFICSICGMRFSLKGNMMTHMKVHTGEKRFICSVCGKRFARKGHLVTHMTIHTGEKPFGCSVCGKRFGQNSTMKKHMAVHTGVKPFSCNVCDKRFTWHYQFKKHACVRRRLETLENFGKIAGDIHQV